MDIFEAIFTRRSIRKYTAQEIGEQDLLDCLKAAMCAPSACNEQPWEFIVCKTPETKTKLAGISPYTHMAKDASTVVVVCADTTPKKAEGFWPQDCAASIENLLLAARGKGIGCVWCGVHPVQDRVEKISAILQLPDRITPVGMICMGFPAQKFEEADRYNPSKIHREKWQG